MRENVAFILQFLNMFLMFFIRLEVNNAMELKVAIVRDDHCTDLHKITKGEE